MRKVNRVLAISDIHGENKKLLTILDKASYDPKNDVLVVCGDMIDRGTENMETLRTCLKLQEQGAVLLKGNHEQFAQECLADMILEKPSEALRLWVIYNGGENTYDEFTKLSKPEMQEWLNFFRKLPLYYTYENYIFVHAGADSRKPIEKNSEPDLVWSDQKFPYCPAYKGKTVIFGHTPTINFTTPSKHKGKDYMKASRIWYDPLNKDKIGIDCGNGFGGRLALLELPSGKEFYI